MTTTVLLLVVTALSAEGTVSAATERRVSRSYVGRAHDPLGAALVRSAAGGDVSPVCQYADDPGFGVACFGVHDGESQVDVEVVDSTGLRVSGVISFEDAFGHEIARTEFCGSATVAVPLASSVLIVLLDSVYVRCTELVPGPATSGVVEAAFR